MLELVIKESEIFTENEAGEGFFDVLPTVTLQLEHSLLSISKWESTWGIAFLGKEKKTNEQILDYVRCMNLGKPIGNDVLERLSEDNVRTITNYIHNPMTATVISDLGGPPSREVVTSELIYYWMIALNIPFECQKWHLNRLLTLIKVCNLKNSPGKKMSRTELLRRNRALNEQRKAQLGTRG